jgi:hypothetical protein
MEWMVIGIFETVAAFFSVTIYYMWGAGTIAWTGYGISRSRPFRKMVALPIMGFAISLVISNGANLIIEPEFSVYNFIFSIIIGFVLLFAAVFIEKSKPSSRKESKKAPGKVQQTEKK